jgi:hypothetical protein
MLQTDPRSVARQAAVPPPSSNAPMHTLRLASWRRVGKWIEYHASTCVTMGDAKVLGCEGDCSQLLKHLGKAAVKHSDPCSWLGAVRVNETERAK